MVKQYDNSWDTDDSGDTFERKCEKWRRRDWGVWLREHLSFPFDVKREEDMDDSSFNSLTALSPSGITCKHWRWTRRI